MVDKLVNTYSESNQYILDNNVPANTNLSLEEAIYKPGELCPRTTMDFSQSRVMDFFDDHMLEKISVRWLLYFVDWSSHFLDMEDLDIQDKVYLTLNRFIVVSYTHCALKMWSWKKRNMLFGCGVYLPTEGEEFNLITLSGP